jgi:hypothetical protein
VGHAARVQVVACIRGPLVASILVPEEDSTQGPAAESIQVLRMRMATKVHGVRASPGFSVGNG